MGQPGQTTALLRYAAFADTPTGGNPAGVVLDAAGLGEAQMQSIATEVGYSETAFLVAGAAAGRYGVRYFSPAAEVPFCGHATIASAVALAERGAPAELVFETAAGTVAVETRREASGQLSATLTSVEPSVGEVRGTDLAPVLAALRWSAAELDPSLPPRIAFAGARHLVLAARTRARLASLDYDFERLRSLMLEGDLTTVMLAWRESKATYHARNPFPVGGVVEDPATGAAAAAFGAYLRELGAVRPPAGVTIFQGAEIGRPSRLVVTIPPGTGGIAVTGQAVPIEAP